MTIKAGDRDLSKQSETFGVGVDEGSPVLGGYAAGTPFPGKISDVLFDFTSARKDLGAPRVWRLKPAIYE